MWFKSRDITLPKKVCIVKGMVFPVVTYGCESWTVNKAVRQRINAFELWSWRRLLKVPWTARKSNQSILREINPEYSLEGWCWNWSSSILVIWCLQMTNGKFYLCMERLRAEGEEGIRAWDGWMASPMQWTWANSDTVRDREAWLTEVHGVKESDMTGKWSNNNMIDTKREW